MRFREAMPSGYYCEECMGAYRLWEKDYSHPHVMNLDIGDRPINCLRWHCIRTVDELSGLSDSTLLRMKNFGRKSLLEVRDAIRRYNPPRPTSQPDNLLGLTDA